MTQTARQPSYPLQQTQGFLSQLEVFLSHPLLFDLGDGKRVPAGYHVTEVKAVDYQTVDCGGVTNHWRETVIQLASGGPDEQTYMNAGKFLNIYGKVAPKVPLQASSELMFEYGNKNAPAVHYHVASVALEPEGVVIYLDWQGVRCKAKDRKTAELAELTVLEGTAASCAPGGSGCGC